MDQDILAVKNPSQLEDVFGQTLFTSDVASLDANTLRRLRLRDNFAEFLSDYFLQFPHDFKPEEVIKKWNEKAIYFAEGSLEQVEEETFYRFTLFVIEGSMHCSMGAIEIGASDFKIYVENLANFVSDYDVCEQFSVGHRGIVDGIVISLETLPEEQIPEKLRKIPFAPSVLHQYKTLWDRSSLDELIFTYSHRMLTKQDSFGLDEYIIDRIDSATEYALQFILDYAEINCESEKSAIVALEKAVVLCEIDDCPQELREEFQAQIRFMLAKEYFAKGDLARVKEVLEPRLSEIEVDMPCDDRIRMYVMLDLADRVIQGNSYDSTSASVCRDRAVEIYTEYKTDTPSNLLFKLLPDLRFSPEFKFGSLSLEESLAIFDEAMDWYMLHENSSIAFIEPSL